jgi:hypothetical protein
MPRTRSPSSSASPEARCPPRCPPPSRTRTPCDPTAERKDIQQWTVRLSKALIDHLKAVAYERRMPPSQLVEELVWKALNNRQSSFNRGSD